MILFANGDSHTYGEGIEEGLPTFADIVGEHFDLTVLNRATPGGSNDCILRTSGRHHFNSNFFVLIGWTSWEREEWIFQNHFYQINGTGHSTLPSDLHDRYKQWIINNNYKTMVLQSQKWHEKIYSYHLALQAKGIKHLFFNAFTPFMDMDTPAELLTFPRYNWENCFIGPYSSTSTYYDHLKEKGFKPNEHYHFKANAHRAWARYLISHIEEHNLI